MGGACADAQTSETASCRLLLESYAEYDHYDYTIHLVLHFLLTISTFFTHYFTSKACRLACTLCTLKHIHAS